MESEYYLNFYLCDACLGECTASCDEMVYYQRNKQAPHSLIIEAERVRGWNMGGALTLIAWALDIIVTLKE